VGKINKAMAKISKNRKAVLSKNKSGERICSGRCFKIGEGNYLYKV